MKINKVIPCGFCKGVINAIELAKQTKLNNPNEEVYILGMIVHNNHVVNDLNKLGIKTLDSSHHTKEELIDSIDKGIVILSAHGTPNHLKEYIVNKGLTLIDATCKDVIKTEDNINTCLNQGKIILYYGMKDHPEAISALSISDRVHLINDNTSLDFINNNDNYAFISQTTMSKTKSLELFEKLKTKTQKIEYINGTCNATEARQNAIKNIENCDVLYIIGDKISNNTNKLKDIAIEKGIKKVFLIDNKDEININDLNENDNVYIAAGASTPSYLIDEAINKLNSIF